MRQGKITVRHQGGGAKKKYRIVDFKEKKRMVFRQQLKQLSTIRTEQQISHLICYADGEKAYILAPNGLKVGHEDYEWS